jgi:hypothetical protein
MLYAYSKWLESVNAISYDEIEAFSETGYLYPTGHSLSFRPLLVLNVERASSNQHLFPTETAVKTTDFIVKYAEMEMGLPGIAEAFDIIVDLENMSLWYLPYETVKQMCASLANNFRGRNGRVFVVNQGFILRSITQVFLSSIDEIT